MPRYFCRSTIVFSKLKIIYVWRMNVRYDTCGIGCRIEDEWIVLKLDVADDRGVKNVRIDRIGKKDEDGKQGPNTCQMRGHALKASKLLRAATQCNMTKGSDHDRGGNQKLTKGSSFFADRQSKT